MKKANFEYRDFAYEIFEHKLCNTICEYRPYGIGSGECQHCDYFQGKFPGNIIRCSHPKLKGEIPVLRITDDNLLSQRGFPAILPKWVSATWRIAAAMSECRWVTLNENRKICFWRNQPYFDSKFWQSNTYVEDSSFDFKIPMSLLPENFETAIYEIRMV